MTGDYHVVGYVPRYHSRSLIQLRRRGARIQVTVEQSNLAPTPWPRTLLCKATAPWPSDFEPFDDEHSPLADLLEEGDVDDARSVARGRS